MWKKRKKKAAANGEGVNLGNQDLKNGNSSVTACG
jgi:hypothetical protein